jgi:hypothetical protein
MMRRFQFSLRALLGAMLVLPLATIACRFDEGHPMPHDAPDGNDESVVKHDMFVEFESRCGNRIVHPSSWAVEDQGDSLQLTSPDGQVRITVLTFTVDGSGSFSDFQNLVVSSLEGDWQDSSWTHVDINGIGAKKKCLSPTDESDSNAWLVYALQTGEYFHAILVRASPLVMELNGGFYEEVARSFKGCS